MIRTVAGWWLIGLVVTGLIVGSQVLKAPTAGTAERLPPAVAPAVGSCVGLTDNGDRLLVDCSEPHVAEITAAWSAELPHPGSSSRSGQCGSAAYQYIGAQPGSPAGEVPAEGPWTPPSTWIESAFFSGPGDVLVPGWSWTACVVRPVLPLAGPGTYLGSVREVDVVPASHRSVDLRHCYLTSGATGTRTDCREGHRGELIASRVTTQLQQPAGGHNINWTASSTDVSTEEGACRELAAGFLGVDPAEHHHLAVTVSQVRFGSGYVSQQGVSQEYLRYRITCAVELTGSGLLTDSLAGLGTGALPLG